MKSIQQESSRKLDIIHLEKTKKQNLQQQQQSLIKTFNFDDKLKNNICVTENNKEKHMLLRYPLEMHGK
jgi:hypothetical protein